ncbi:hypothetical protein BGCPKDLD_1062 [Methylorubrum suomiense]|uniref:Uncharacterized protein n=1 Tax=Methylorubrum suomiense TaxID=144191 RepID=A0ABQ4UQ94_9HYPH|nr:hypothetical protein BGCPKDLD_1062 [Methylorubrum suomiense]
MPRWLQITLSLALFAAVMLALRWVLHATVPDGIRWADAAIGENTVTVIMVVVFCACAYFGWGPSLRAWLAKRRGSAVGQRHQAPGEEFGVRRPDGRFRERP